MSLFGNCHKGLWYFFAKDFFNIFSGNHECVAVINNFVPKESVSYYTRKQPFEETPKLPLNMAKPLHQLVMTVS